MSVRQWQHLAVLALLCASCTSITPTVPQRAEPVVVSGVRGPLPLPQSATIVSHAVSHAPDPASMQSLIELMQTLSPEPLYADNRVGLLVDGPATYSAMLAAVRGAHRYVHMEMYIIGDDEVGRTFANALMGKAAEGVPVRLLYDSIGSLGSGALFDELRAGGVDVMPFNPVNPLAGGNPLKVNNRDHRKILVVDGDTAFTGGLNINRDYASGSTGASHGDDSRPSQHESGEGKTGAATVRDGASALQTDGHDHGASASSSMSGSKQKAGWRDTDIIVQGPAAAALERSFAENWQRSGGEMDDANVQPAAYGKDLVRVLSSVGGDGRVSPIRTAYELAIDKATARVWITQPYFAPDRRFLDALRAAVSRGVDVRLLLPSTSDSAMVLSSARYHYTGLLKGGVRIFESNDTMLHAKTAVIDGVWSTVGSSNLDYRSFLHNDEVNAVVLGAGFGAELERRFEADQSASTEIELTAWQHRGAGERMKEFFAHAFAYWL